MSDPRQQLIALGAVFESAALVDKLARTGQISEAPLGCMLGSLLARNPASTLDVYGGDSLNLRDGFKALASALERKPGSLQREPLRYALAMLTLERQLDKRGDMLDLIGQRLDQVEQQVQHFGLVHENVIASFASIYQDTLSTFRQRIQVHGDMRHLQVSSNAARIRALLLAGIRSARLWRQLGGSRWQMVFSRRRLLNELYPCCAASHGHGREPAATAQQPDPGRRHAGSFGAVLRPDGRPDPQASSTVNNETVVFFRNLVGVLFFLPLALTRGIGPLRTRRPLSHLLRTTYGLGGMYCYFYALAHLPLTDAMLFSYAAPVFTPLIAHLWIKEPLTRRMMVATLVGFLGVLLVARPSGAVVAPIALVGIASSLMAACAFVSIREMSDSEPAYRIVFYFALFGTLFSAVPLAWAWQPLNGQELLLLLGAGLFASLGQLTMSQAYALASPGVIGPIAYMAIVFAGVIAWLRWDELPSHTSLLGAALIFAASLIPCWATAPPKGPAECPTGAHLSCMICAPFR